jgi:hypothetical protein
VRRKTVLKLDTQDPHMADIFRRAKLERENQDKRIADIFGKQNVPKVTEETLAIYLAYLKQHLEMPYHLTGIETLGCFSWEEYYTFGPGSEKEYQKLKKKQPSYTDTYTLLSFEDGYDEYEGIYVKVWRIADKKQFMLPLANLKAIEKGSDNYQLLYDYAVWVANWRR